VAWMYLGIQRHGVRDRSSIMFGMVHSIGKTEGEAVGGRVACASAARARVARAFVPRQPHVPHATAGTGMSTGEGEGSKRTSCGCAASGG
jgi:hypothetical protein